MSGVPDTPILDISESASGSKLGIVSAEPANDVGLCRNDYGATHSNAKSQNSVDSRASSTCIQFLVQIFLILSRCSCANADYSAEHEGHADQMQPTNLLFESTIEDNDVEDTGKAEQRRDNAWV